MKKLSYQSKRRLIIMCGYGVVLTTILFVVLNVAFSCTLFDSQGMISVVFDKWQMNAADRIVITAGEKEVTITDKEVVEQFVGETLVGTTTGICWYSGVNKRVDVYKGDHLIRTMVWGSYYNDFVEVYRTDKMHWNINTFGDDRAIVEISTELRTMLIDWLGEDDFIE